MLENSNRFIRGNSGKDANQSGLLAHQQAGETSNPVTTGNSNR